MGREKIFARVLDDDGRREELITDKVVRLTEENLMLKEHNAKLTAENAELKDACTFVKGN